MTKSNKNRIQKNFSIVIGSILALLYFTVPGLSNEFSGVVTGELNIGTGYHFQQVKYPIVQDILNLHSGAEITLGIMAMGGSTINFYGGQVMDSSYIFALTNSTIPKITVYGSNFSVNGLPCDPSATMFTLAPGQFSILTGFYSNGEPINLKFYGNIPINLVTLNSGIVVIDIKPGDEQKSINLKSNGVVPVAVLTTEQFDAATINPISVRFASAAPVNWSMEDVDNDGDYDIILHFRTQELDLTDESTEATLTAQLISKMILISTEQTGDGRTVSGTSTIRIVGMKLPKK